MKAVVCSTVCLLLAVLPSCVAQSKKPSCANSCDNLDGVTHEVQRTITDDGATCKLDPKYEECILLSCDANDSKLPQSMLTYLKEDYGCDLSGSAGQKTTTSCLVTLILGLLIISLFK